MIFFFCQERKKIYHKILLLALDVWQQDSARAEESMGANVGDGTKRNCALRLQGDSFCVCYKCMQFPLKCNIEIFAVCLKVTPLLC